MNNLEKDVKYDKMDVCIVITTYQCPKHIDGLLKSILYQGIGNYGVVVADDGSKDNTVEIIKKYHRDIQQFKVLALEHGERGVARHLAIKEAVMMNPRYLLILDADMILRKDLLKQATMFMDREEDVDGLVIREIPFTGYRNFYSKVKVFERYIINNSKDVDMKHSIEAARFWRLSSYLATGGINPEQTAFEEIQPTIRCIDNGGVVRKLQISGVFHDEKRCTLINLLKKKRYYFSQMQKTMSGEKDGFKKALSRWYLFRPVYYEPQNLMMYAKYPIYFMGMVQMYFLLTVLGCYETLRRQLMKLIVDNKEVSL